MEKKYYYFLKLLVTLLIFYSSSTLSQISSPPTEISDEIKKKFPFMGENIYNIEYANDNGGEGMTVFTIDKKLYQEYMLQKIRDTLDTLSNRYKFYDTACTSGFNDCGEKYSQIYEHLLKNTSSDFQVNNNTSIIGLSKFQLTAKYKKVYRARVNFSCRKTTNYYDISLLNTEFFVQSKFTYDERKSSIIILNNINVILNILFDKCGGLSNFSSPYRQINTFNSNAKNELKIDFSSLAPISFEWIKILTLNTKRINVHEDEKYYYVYCIREK
ncbi:hypothetical protein ACFSJW_07510 [Flavobacterium artemisiae]|uniref:Uncharacterized protein n=1 Tax=Flavobacterium artemisiae TaxID=2126556 RepID=A0ABW4HC34_9FLAO